MTERATARCSALLALLVDASLPGALLPAPARAAEWKDRATRYAVVYFQAEQANTAEQLAGMVDPIIEQMAALHDYTARTPLPVRLYNSVEAYAQSSDLARTPYGQVAQADPRARELALAEPRLRNLTPEQIRNLLRRGASQLMLAEQSGGRLPVGLLQGAAQYSEQVSPEVEVGARALDKARRDRAMLSWADLNAPDRFAAQSEVAAAQGYAVVAFLLDRYGLTPWSRFVALNRGAADWTTALAQAYGKPAATLEGEWQAYLAEYFGGSFRLNAFGRYDLAAARAAIQAGRYVEARDEVEALSRFIAEKGSVCLDGVSLTVNAVAGVEFDVNIVPHTLPLTTLNDPHVAHPPNLELDVSGGNTIGLTKARAVFAGEPVNSFSAIGM